MIEIAYGVLLPVLPEQAFRFVSDPLTWPRFFATVKAAHASGDWGRPGGRAWLETQFLGRMIRYELELTEWEPPRLFRYLVHQIGRPDQDNRRLFEPIEGVGTRLRGTTGVTPRAGMAGMADQLSLRALQRIYDDAMAQLATVIPRTESGRAPGPQYRRPG
jgi:hypothetical protein